VRSRAHDTPLKRVVDKRRMRIVSNLIWIPGGR